MPDFFHQDPCITIINLKKSNENVEKQPNKVLDPYRTVMHRLKPRKDNTCLLALLCHDVMLSRTQDDIQSHITLMM